MELNYERSQFTQKEFEDKEDEEFDLNLEEKH